MEQPPEADYQKGFRDGLITATNSLKMSAQTIRLHAGELSAQEMRTVQAVLRWKIDEIKRLAST